MAKKNRFRTASLIAAALVFVLAIAGCSVQENSEGDNKRVTVETPFGDLKVNTAVEAKDVGMKLYPGATPRDSSGDDKHSANVQIGNDRFGLKVIAAEYESQDAPEKVLDFYRNELKSYGEVLECKGVRGNPDPNVIMHGKEGDELSCGKGDGKGNAIELKAGTSDRQRIVAVHPNGSGSRFALVYIQKRGKDM